MNPPTQTPSKRRATTPLQLPQAPVNRGLNRDSQQPVNYSEAYPFFDDGDVVIDFGPSNQVFQLHSSILTRQSPFFAKAIRPPAHVSQVSKSWHLFTLSEANSTISLIYHGRKATGIPAYKKPNLSLDNGVKIKLEDDAIDDIQQTIKSYTVVLAFFYGIPFSTSTNNTTIKSALNLAEQVVRTSNELESLHLVRPHLGKFLNEYRHDLFLAIKDDPPRWIKLGEALENKAIYAECLVHLVGAYPRWGPWATAEVKNPGLLEVIRKKSREVEQLRIEIERDLLLTSLPYGDRALDPTQREQAETWLVVGVFRDQLAQEIHRLNPTDKIGAFGAVWKRGTFFRGLAKGLFEPLDGERVRRVCQMVMRAEWTDLLDDLEHLKEYAKQVVGELAVNELMIDPDANGVGYLTCVKVEDEDIPWLAAKRNVNV